MRDLDVPAQARMTSAGSAIRWVTGLVTAEMVVVHPETAEVTETEAVTDAATPGVDHPHLTDAEVVLPTDVIAVTVVTVRMVQFAPRSLGKDFASFARSVVT